MDSSESRNSFDNIPIKHIEEKKPGRIKKKISTKKSFRKPKRSISKPKPPGPKSHTSLLSGTVDYSPPKEVNPLTQSLLDQSRFQPTTNVDEKNFLKQELTIEVPDSSNFNLISSGDYFSPKKEPKADWE
jgi:hypothetical protein